MKKSHLGWALLLVFGVSWMAFAKTSHPVKNFEYLWKKFQNNYAFFALRRVSWSKLYERYKPRVKKTKTKKELFCVLNSMLGHLRDGHVSLTSKEFHVDKCNLPHVPKDPARRFLKLARRLAKRHVIKMQTYKKGVMYWGRLKQQPSIGYIQLNDLDEMVDCKYMFARHARELRQIKYKGKSRRKGKKIPCKKIKDIHVANILMRKVLRQFKGTQGLILDVRFNGGGDDEVAAAVMGYFTKTKALVYTKREMKKGKLTGFKKMYVNPQPIQYPKHTVVLASPMTMSAAEILTLAARQLSTVTLMGSNTNGILSDMQYGYLPIGWKYTLSNEIYYSPSGKTYEKVGVPPQVRIPYPRKDVEGLYRMLGAPKDVGIQKALQVLLPRRQ
ncbi:MAG: hypothetical protein EP343_03505 [Deltaproteobacteria bacterium]|nr:MAG: hypothetical protein EP343_03505 [Deltaproteobacteria bacterium]